LTGLIVENEDEAVTAVRRARMLDRMWVRQRFEERFSIDRMVADYCALYSGAAEQSDMAKRTSAKPAIPSVRA
jgi:hypothetical protein